MNGHERQKYLANLPRELENVRNWGCISTKILLHQAIQENKNKHHHSATLGNTADQNFSWILRDSINCKNMGGNGKHHTWKISIHKSYFPSSPKLPKKQDPPKEFLCPISGLLRKEELGNNKEEEGKEGKEEEGGGENRS
ncbi:hypothetical protein M9H77_35625 [Catharanthus roseus]|uniref:Uncharacterized protein n=1 Tax=Catharanthus roseus TaxID=4058 RepID=A0ACB9ZQB0_CATRO|nr:hypothetical protein M9H77_35625 [Catharanthus roseus]